MSSHTHDGHDAYDANDATGTWDSLKDTPPRNPPQGSGNSGGGKLSQALLAFASNQARVFKGDDGVFYLAEHVRGIEAYAIRSTRTRRWLNRLFRRQMGKPPSGQTISETVEALESLAETNGVYPVRVRIAALEERVLLDLSNLKGQVIDITSTGWNVRDVEYWKDKIPPIYFVRPEQMLPLPLPDTTGTLVHVQTLLTKTTALSAEWMPLTLAFLLHCFQQSGDFWNLVLQGEQGSAKSHTAESLRMLIDPARTRSSGPPRDEDALVAHANVVGIVVLDNLSHIDEWLSDALCRLSTGSGIVKRKLFTDMDVSAWFGKRPVILATITDIVRAGDLLDRALIIPLPRIEDGKYISKIELGATFNKAHPKALGGLLNALVGVLQHLPTVRKEYHGKLPRMTDACLYGLALERWQGKSNDSEQGFLALYRANRKDALALQLEGSQVVEYLKRLTRRGVWKGTMTELLTSLNDKLEVACGVEVARETRRERSWPKTPNHLSGMLTRMAPALREAGFTIERAKLARGEPFQYVIGRTVSDDEGSE